MKKLMFMLGGAFIAGGIIFAVQSYATSLPALPTQTEISELKASNPKNNNMLTATMWDKMLDLLGRVNQNVTNLTNDKQEKEVNLKEFCNCDGKNNGELCKFNSNKINCNNLNHIARFINDGGFPVDQPYNLANMAKKSRNLGKNTFCALSSVAFFDHDASEEWAEEICRVFKYNDNWYLYANGRQADSYCSATCF